MSLSEINKREKDFHNNLQKKEGRKFESNFYKAIKNMFDDFHAKIKENCFQNNILDFGCGIGKNLETVVNFNPKEITAIDISDDTQTEQNEINNKPLSYYKFIPDKMTWAEHNNQAIAMGGKLASISNAIENNKVKEVSTGVNVWLGGVRKGCGNDTGADHWYRSSGEKWSYTNRIKNQPDNYQKSEVSKIEWKTYFECLQCIRSYNLEKKQIIENLYKSLQEYNIIY